MGAVDLVIFKSDLRSPPFMKPDTTFILGKLDDITVNRTTESCNILDTLHILNKKRRVHSGKVKKHTKYLILMG